MNINMRNLRNLIQVFILIASALPLLIAYYFQYVYHYSPCSLCLLQQITYFLILILTVVTLVRDSKGLSIIRYAVTLIGIFIATYHLYLQHYPEANVICGMPLPIIYQQFGFYTYLKSALSINCSTVTWKIFGVSAVYFSLVGYILIGTLSIYNIAYKKFLN